MIGHLSTKGFHTIAFLDDHADTVDVMVELFGEQGHSVEGYTDARAFIDRALRKPALSLAIVDYRLHGTTGVDVARDLRAAGVDMPIVLLTATHPRFVDRRALASLGIAHVLMKPALDELGRLLEARSS